MHGVCLLLRQETKVADANISIVTANFYSLASAASDLETGINMLSDVTQRRNIVNSASQNGTTTTIDPDDIATLQTILVPVLQYFQSTPIRAIVITAMVSIP